MQRDLIRSSDGLASAVLIRASENLGSQPLLVCIHGGGCSSGYFDLPGCSTVDGAMERGFTILLVNRPGYAGNPPIGGNDPIEKTATIICSLIEQVRSEHLPESSGIVVIGHSIGGAVALLMAASGGDWPLRAVAVSGIGDVPSAEVMELRRSDSFFPNELTASLFLGPEGTYGWEGLIKLRRAAEPWRIDEVADVVEKWPSRWPQAAAQIDVPVHLRLAEHERIWQTGEEAVERMAVRLYNSSFVDAAVLPAGGHLYEIHKRGPELISSQLNFLEQFAAPSAAGGLIRTA